MKKFKYKVIFLQKSNDNWIVVKSVKLRNINNPMLKLKDRAYCIDYSHPNYLIGLVYVYFVELKTGKTLSFHEIESIDPSLIDFLFSQKIVQQITTGINREVSSINWTWLIIGLVIGGMVMSLIVMVVMQKRIDDLLTNAIILP